MSFLSAEKKEELKPGQIVWIIPDFKTLSIVWEIPVIKEEVNPSAFSFFSNRPKRYKLGIEYAAGELPKDRVYFYRNRDEIYDTQEDALKAVEKILLSERDKINEQYKGSISRISACINNLRNKLKG